MLENMEPMDILLIGGGILGLVFGFLGQSSRFCFRQAAIEAFDRTRAGQLRGWLIASLIAIAGTQYLIPAYDIDYGESAYWVDSLAIVSLVVGGVMFGIGMMLARGCAGRQVVLAATGNLRSLIVIMTIALTGYMTMRGLFAPIRHAIEGIWQVPLENPDVVQSVSALADADVDPIRMGAIVLCLVLAAGLFARSLILRDRLYLSIASVVIGVAVVGGWYVTGVIGYDDFEPQRLESLTFVAPGGNAMQFLMIYTGATANFGILLIGGVILGSFVSAVLRRELKLQGFTETREMLRYMTGGALMGAGAVMAIGCSIGQGLSGISTLAFSSIISISAIVVGARIGHAIMKRNEAAVQAKLAAAE